MASGYYRLSDIHFRFLKDLGWTFQTLRNHFKKKEERPSYMSSIKSIDFSKTRTLDNRFKTKEYYVVDSDGLREEWYRFLKSGANGFSNRMTNQKYTNKPTKSNDMNDKKESKTKKNKKIEEYGGTVSNKIEDIYNKTKSKGDPKDDGEFLKSVFNKMQDLANENELQPEIVNSFKVLVVTAQEYLKLQIKEGKVINYETALGIYLSLGNLFKNMCHTYPNQVYQSLASKHGLSHDVVKQILQEAFFKFNNDYLDAIQASQQDLENEKQKIINEE